MDRIEFFARLKMEPMELVGGFMDEMSISGWGFYYNDFDVERFDDYVIEISGLGILHKGIKKVQVEDGDGYVMEMRIFWGDGCPEPVVELFCIGMCGSDNVPLDLIGINLLDEVLINEFFVGVVVNVGRYFYRIKN